MSAIKNYELNPPKKLSDLNKESMLQYIIAQNDTEALSWFLDLCETHKIKKVRTMDARNGSFKKGDIYITEDIAPIRKAFARKYFPNLVEKKTKTKKTTPTWEDMLEEARKKVNK